jgi:hypothetical protein
MATDPRSSLLTKSFNLLTEQEKRDKKNYSMVLFRLAKKAESGEYNQNAMLHMRIKRAESKIKDAKIIEKEGKIKEENKNISVLLNNKDRVIKKLEKENKKLEQKNLITDIIGSKPIKNIKATPTINADKRTAKIKIISNVIEKIYDFKLSTVQINLFNNLMNKKPSITKQKIDESFKNLQFLKNEGITDFIKELINNYPAPATSKNYLAVFQYFLNILSKMPDVGKPYFEEAYFKLNTITKSYNKAYTDKKSTGKIEEKRKGLLFDYSPSETMKKLDNFEFNNSTDKLIYAYYTLMPPRRVSDVYILEITEQTDITKLVSKTNNYIMINKNGNVTKVIYNDYKTSDTYEQQVFKLDNKLSDMIQEYIKEQKIDFKTKRFLFSNKTHTSPSKESSNFSNKIQMIFNRVYNITDENGNIRKSNGISADIIRESSSTYYVKKYSLTPDKLNDIAKMQGHSLSKIREYSKNISFDTDTNIYKNVQESGIQKTKEEIFRDNQVLKKNKIPIVKIVESKIETLPIVDDNIRRSTRNRNRSR